MSIVSCCLFTNVLNVYCHDVISIIYFCLNKLNVNYFLTRSNTCVHVCNDVRVLSNVKACMYL